MPKKNDTSTPPVPEWFREQYESRYAPIPTEWYEDLMETPDDEVGRLLKAILYHTIKHETVIPEGFSKREFRMMLRLVDYFLEYGLENQWKAVYRAQKAAKARWINGKEKEPDEDPKHN